MGTLCNPKMGPSQNIFSEQYGAMENNLRKIRESLGLSQDDAAAKMGTTRSQYVKLERGERRMTEVWIPKAAEAFGVSPGAIIDSTYLPGGQLQLVTPKMEFIPVRGEVAAGLWRQYDELSQDLGEPDEYASFVAAKGYPKEQQFSLKVKGHSLNRIAPEGSMLHCVEHINGGAWDVYEDQLVIVQHSKFQGQMIEHTAKRIRRGKDGTFELWPESDHPDFQKPLKVKDFHKDDCDEEIRILAKVISIQRKP